jgi:signal transduction histidine kinase/DNA-binding NarL/FixJ family response regulator
VTGHGAEPRATPAPPAGGVAPGDATILLVDDEEANLDLLAAVLRPRGYTRLVRVSDARTALAAFEDARPDLVLLDLHMPHRSGFEVLADLAARVPAAEFLPVLVLTADVTAQARERALAGGAHDFVLKPFDRTEVLLRVRNLLHARHLHLAQQRAREAAERQAARARLLADATRLLGLSFDTATALGALAGRLVPAWADGCAIEMDGGEGPVTVASAGAIGGEVLRVPLAAAEAPPVETPAAGTLVAARGPGRAPFDTDDHELAVELARRAALAVENARLFHAAQEAVATRDRVLAVVAHDLRSPLTAVRFDVEMLRADPAAPLAEGDARTLARIERAAARMDALIEDLLDATRIGRDALALERRPHDMGALLAEAAESLRPIVEAQGLRFTADGPVALPTLAVDGRRVLQAIANLVGNAAKFAAHGGAVALGWRVAGDALEVSVGDDGAGIPPDALQHIFGAFWQARDADRRGLGLGLAIARGIAEAHGGRLWVESVVGTGSTFVLALPIGARG